jgi:hypothetical protein
MRLRSILLAVLASIAATSSLAADSVAGGQSSVTPRAVVELYTSQGCSSCPPADALLGKLAADPSIIALSFPVDYWNYLGWKDTFGSPRNSERQRNYARARGDGAIYTPQAIINGEVHVNGASEAEIEKAIQTTSEKVGPQHIPIRFWQERNTLNFALGGEEPGHAAREATIWLGVVQSSGTVDIKEGENQGKQLTYTNIVRELTPIGLWRGQPLEIQLPRAALMQAEIQKIVVLLQEDRSGPIIGGMLAGLW